MATILEILVTTLALIVLLVDVVLVFLIGSSFDIHTLLTATDTLTLLLLAVRTCMQLSLLLLTFLATLLLGLLLGTCTLVQRVKVYLTHYIQVGRGNLLLCLQSENYHFLTLGRLFFSFWSWLFLGLSLNLHLGFLIFDFCFKTFHFRFRIHGNDLLTFLFLLFGLGSCLRSRLGNWSRLLFSWLLA